MPVIVPPVPTPATRCVIRPPVCSHSSGPVERVVRGGVGLVEVLVGLERAGDLLGQPVGDAVVGLRRVGRDLGRRDDDLGAVGAQQVDLLLRHLVRHDRDDAVALQPRGDGEAGAGVARGRLDDRAAGRSLPSRSAASMSATATRSLIDPPGFSASTLATSCGLRPAPSGDSRTSGVSPIASRIESLMFGSSWCRWPRAWLECRCCAVRSHDHPNIRARMRSDAEFPSARRRRPGDPRNLERERPDHQQRARRARRRRALDVPRARARAARVRRRCAASTPRSTSARSAARCRR